MKKLIKSAFFPPVFFRIVFGLLSLLAVACVFIFHVENAPIAYVSFLASALGLYYLITVTIFPLAKRVRALLMRNKYVRRYYENKELNARVSLYWGLIINIFYAVFKLSTGLYYRSEWMIAIAVYYGILILLKYMLVHYDIRLLRNKTDNDELRDWTLYRRIGWLMLLINIGLSGIVAQVVAQNRSYSYPGTIIFAVAAYSFYRIVIAVIHLLKDRKNRNPVFSAAKIIDFSFAVTAMFTLQTAMFASFAEGLDVRIPNIITGTAVALIITALAVIMIAKATRKIKQLSDRVGNP